MPLGSGLGYMYTELALIGLQTLLLTIIMIFFARGLTRTILTALLELDSKIATAIQQIVEGNIEIPDAPNPFQQLLMQVVMKNMGSEPNIELVRDTDGKFK